MGLSGITVVPREEILYADGKECLRVAAFNGGHQIAGARKMLEFLGMEHECEHRDIYTSAEGPWAPDGMTPQLATETEESDLGLSDPD